MKIYTKTGDEGQTGLVGGSRVSKASLRIEAIGSVDEANAAFGAVLGAPPSIAEWIPWIQSRLFEVGAELASPPGSQRTYQLLKPSDIQKLERAIDSMDEHLPPLTTFILPGGSHVGAALHVARAASRRAERSIVGLSKSGSGAVRGDLIAFLNRLSDWTFTAARFANREVGEAEVPWTEEGNR